MSFEENFPSLKDKELTTWLCVKCKAYIENEMDRENGYFRCSSCGSEEYFEETVALFEKKDIFEHCLDKAKVNAWFKDKSTKPKCSGQDSRRQLEARQKREAFRMVWEELEKEMLKELGLEK